MTKCFEERAVWKLEQLLEGVPFTLAQGSLDTEISDIIYDSRKAAPGLLFVCIVGTQRDSHEFAADCAAKGVSALVIQHDIDLSAMPGVTVVKVESSRYAMALMSANLFGNPSRKMTMIGVTGTKGKTTTTHMIKSVLEAAGRKVGMIGTNGIYYMGRHKETSPTPLPKATNCKDLPGVSGCRLRHRADGGFQPGPDDGPRGRCALQCGRVHQPFAGSHRPRRAQDL